MARPRWQYILLFLSFLSISLAASPTSFCKCTCFTNSTIIPLDAIEPSGTPEPDAPSDSDRAPVAQHRRTCNDCNKQFCLDSDLAICKDAKEDDVFTTCFQRDSAKDEAIVFIFIFTTLGLLGWAAVKPVFEKWREGRRSMHSYAPVEESQ